MNISSLMIQDALRYMQVPKSKAGDETLQKIIDGFNKLYQISTPKYIYHSFHIRKDNLVTEFEGTSFEVKSSDLTKLFESCQRCYLLAATLGQSVDREIGIKQKVDMLDAVILDACASVLIEKLCDEAEQKIAAEVSDGEFLTMRFSPGYGDVPLEVQQELIEVMVAAKKIGLSLTYTNMLIPTKSITAFIGISSKKENRMKNCGACNLAASCLYKERGNRCGL